MPTEASPTAIRASRSARRPESSPAVNVALSRLRVRLTAKAASAATTKIYIGWIRRFLMHAASRARDPATAIDRFVASLRAATCSPASQRQAIAALGFFYREVLGVDAAESLRAHRPALPRRSPGPAAAINPPDTGGLAMAIALVRRIMEVTGRPAIDILDLRIGDIELDQGQVSARLAADARGGTTRVTLPAELHEAVLEQIGESWRIHQLDFLDWLDARPPSGAGHGRLPSVIFRLQRLFPSCEPPSSPDPACGRAALSRSHFPDPTSRPRARRPRLTSRSGLAARTADEDKAITTSALA
jgi:integrase